MDHFSRCVRRAGGAQIVMVNAGPPESVPDKLP
jgi:hypothetical protein